MPRYVVFFTPQSKGMAPRRGNVRGRDRKREGGAAVTQSYPTHQPNTANRLTETERADLGVQQELAVTTARWGYPSVLSAGEAEQRARDIEALARMARRAVRR